MKVHIDRPQYRARVEPMTGIRMGASTTDWRITLEYLTAGTREWAQGNVIYVENETRGQAEQHALASLKDHLAHIEWGTSFVYVEGK